MERMTSMTRAAAALSCVLGAWSAMSPVAAARPEVPVTADSPRATGWKAVTVLRGLEHPWGMQWLPDGAMLITERPGRLRVARNGALDPKPVTGTPEVFAFGQGGLMDVSLHPKFADNRLIYLTYTEGTRTANRTALARGRYENGALTNVQTIFRVSQTKQGGQHFGSRILWLPDGTLLLSIGDGGNPPVRLGDDWIRTQAQNTGSHLGKVLRLSDDGTPAPGNPFLAKPGALPEVWTLGHRNIQGMCYDAASGRIWATEHGARGGDELNLLQPGKNYGWPKATYSMEYTGPEISPDRSLPGMEDPKVVWTPCIAPSGLTLYTGDTMPGWRGDLFAGGLVLKQIRRIRLNGDKVVGEETLQFDDRVRDVRQGPDGALYVLTDEDDGRLLRIEPER